MSSTRLKWEHVSLSGDLPENGTKISLKELVRADQSVVSVQPKELKIVRPYQLLEILQAKISVSF